MKCVCVCVPTMGLGGTVTLRYHVDVITDSQSLQYLYFVQPLGGRAFSRSSSVLFLLHHDSSHFTCMPASWSPSTLQPHDVTDTKVKGKALSPVEAEGLQTRMSDSSPLLSRVGQHDFCSAWMGCHTHKLCCTAALLSDRATLAGSRRFGFLRPLVLLQVHYQYMRERERGKREREGGGELVVDALSM